MQNPNNEQQSLLALKQAQQEAQAEREAAAKAYEEADKKNRESEKQALKDIGTFVIDTLTPVGDVKAIYEWMQGDKNWKTTLAAVLGVIGVKGSAKSKMADELETLIRQQASDAKGWAKMGGETPPVEVRKAYEEAGVDYGRVRPESMRQANQSAFPPGTDKTRLYNDEFEQLTVGTKHSQEQLNPQATAGLEPQRPATEASRMDTANPQAGATMKHWQSGWDAEQFKKHVESSLKTKARVAAKGKKDSPPEFWIYDESRKSVIVIKRDKDGALFVGVPPKGRPPDPFQRYEEGAAAGKVVRDQFGDPVYSDKIDMVVPKDAEKEANRMIYELMLKRLDEIE